ncbi:MAG TPA: hypothetical protein VJP77_09870 [Planctomycetota bacterium]|nr:hypothetical protein [Planctomycetota bacterium]
MALRQVRDARASARARLEARRVEEVPEQRRLPRFGARGAPLLLEARGGALAELELVTREAPHCWRTST